MTGKRQTLWQSSYLTVCQDSIVSIVWSADENDGSSRDSVQFGSVSVSFHFSPQRQDIKVEDDRQASMTASTGPQVWYAGLTDAGIERSDGRSGKLHPANLGVSIDKV